MVYTLDKADQRCDVTYVDWSKKYSPIPKATCEMIQPKCSSGGGGSYDDSVELKCEDLKKLIHGEDNPKEGEKPKEDANPVEDTPREDTPREETPTEGNASDNLGDTPTEDTPEVNLLELMPRVEGEFSTVAYQDGIVSYILEDSQKQKEDFENNIITTLKGKLPEGAVVEAVLGEPYYKEGSEYLESKTNYTLHVRVTLNGKVYEQEYAVPNAKRPLAVAVDSF